MYLALDIYNGRMVLYILTFSLGLTAQVTAFPPTPFLHNHHRYYLVSDEG